MASKYMGSPGDFIQVRLLGGSHHIQKMVSKYARAWLTHANVELKFVDHDDVDIRVSFEKGGSWSFVGTSCRLVPKDKATMNFGWFTNKTSIKKFSRTVTHEFGRALGCIHEHQSPAGNIPWDESADKETVRANIFEAYSINTTHFLSVDKKSIMLYAIPACLTKNGYSIKPNKVLSEMDKHFIAQAYPWPHSYDSSDDYDDDDREDNEDETRVDNSNSEAPAAKDHSDFEEDNGSDRVQRLSSKLRGKWML
ncbi:hypothetical protein SLS53_007373 [Cytospora paraplurivora]|uniref:Uncharacterized protein n=1 Tax=Cytospora paraplurivora TaxID=2898453 RepID=A0AAN9YCJ1_9PEZI